MSRQGLRRWLVALPGPLVSAVPIAATVEAGAAPLLDFQAPRPGELEAAVRRCPGRVGVRLFEPSEAALAEVVRLGAHWDRVWLSAGRALGEEARRRAFEFQRRRAFDGYVLIGTKSPEHLRDNARLWRETAGA
jgi:hypothetical protein